MVRRTRTGAWFSAIVLMLVTLAACSGDGADDDGAGDTDAEAVEGDDAVLGSFVGKVSGTEAFVAVVAEPSPDGEGPGNVHVYLSDGAGLSEWFSGPISDRTFAATSDDGDAEADGELSADAVTGTVKLADGTTGDYEATPPSGAEGLYDLTVSAAGQLTGASAAGLGVSGEIPPIPPGMPGTGALRLVDGERLEFGVTPTPTGDLAHLRSGQIRLIVLPGGELRGAGKGPFSESGDAFVFVRSR